MVNRTIFGEPVGKWALGTTGPSGQEAALAGKFIGDAVAVDYPTLAVRVPERQRLGENLLGLVAIAGILYWVLKRG